ncbi:MAG: methyltransferase domain-containing protein [Planctomycetota bacterium]|nr:methyltransferase domain-containing protein [Planctomycetota bacterium]MDA1114531.1 methyltransferase domain-containing protein [Planctomycetota bacterium]
MSATRRWYARIAPIYDLVCRPLYAGPRRAALRAMDLQVGHKVLEIGCGTGLNLPMMSAAVGTRGRVLGIDTTTEMLDRAEARLDRFDCDNVALYNGDIMAPPLAALKGILRKHMDTAHPDVILCSYLFAIAPGYKELFERAWQVLRPGGHFVMVDTQPFQGAWRLLNPLAVPIANWSGGGNVRRPTLELLSSLPLTEIETHLGGSVFVARTRKLGNMRLLDDYLPFS